MGFVEYVDQVRREQGATARLFPRVYKTSQISDYFGDLCTRLGLKTKAHSLHSTRHFWETALIRTKCQMELRHNITGHALPRSEGNTSYNHVEWSVQEIQEAIEKVQF
jgi:hypothetical protein